MNIFYADDDEDDREIFVEALHLIDPSINVTLSKDGQEALEALQIQTLLPDFIFLDINMPRMGGVDCLAQLKMDDRLKHIPVVFTSTTINSAELSHLATFGALSFMPKANSLNELVSSVQKILFGSNLLARSA